MNSRRRSQSCDDCVDPAINGLQCPLTQCITQGASFDMESTRPILPIHDDASNAKGILEALSNSLCVRSARASRRTKPSRCERSP